MATLVTGGLGYIGSSFCIQLKYSTDKQIIVVDNVDNFKVRSQLEDDNIICIIGDICDKSCMSTIFSDYPIKYVVHFAALKSVPDSIKHPTLYYNNNVGGLMNLLTCMQDANVNNVIFSSSATVYGNNQNNVSEDSETGKNITNPYGMTKYIGEQLLIDICKHTNINAIILRYFNPVGIMCFSADTFPNSGSLMGNIYSCVEQNKPISIFGNTYETDDGTCLRDFIHLEDLISGHIHALSFLKSSQFCDVENGYEIFNLGTGVPTSVLQLIYAYTEKLEQTIEIEYKEKREGDIAISYCNPEKALRLLDWTARKTIEDI
jgi:UDP-glucose 4-epimerase